MTSESLKTYDLSKIRNDGNFKIGYRNSFLDTPILIGREREIILPNREKHKSYFALVSLDNIFVVQPIICKNQSNRTRNSISTTS